MKSIVLVVLLALCHNSKCELDYSNQYRPSQIGNFRVYQRNGAKPVLISSVNNDDSELVADTSDSDDRVITNSQNEDVSQDDAEKIDCNCNKEQPKITYGPEQIVKGKPETYIHHQPKIIVRQPPTHVRIEHPPTIIQPSTIVFRRHGKTIRRPVVYQTLPQDVRVRPVIVRIVKPIEKKVLIDNNRAIPFSNLEKQYRTQGEEEEKGIETEEDFETYTGQSYSEFNEHESLKSRVNVKETSTFSN